MQEITKAILAIQQNFDRIVYVTSGEMPDIDVLLTKTKSLGIYLPAGQEYDQCAKLIDKQAFGQSVQLNSQYLSQAHSDKCFYQGSITKYSSVLKPAHIKKLIPIDIRNLEMCAPDGSSMKLAHVLGWLEMQSRMVYAETIQSGVNSVLVVVSTVVQGQSHVVAGYGSADENARKCPGTFGHFRAKNKNSDRKCPKVPGHFRSKQKQLRKCQKVPGHFLALSVKQKNA